MPKTWLWDISQDFFPPSIVTETEVRHIRIKKKSSWTHYVKITKNSSAKCDLPSFFQFSSRKNEMPTGNFFISNFSSTLIIQITGRLQNLVLFLKIITLFRNKRFILNLIPQWNTSKFAIFYEYENPKLFFPFFISCNFIFPLINALVYVDID